MLSMARERRSVWFAAFSGKEQVVDGEGRLTGAWRIRYGEPFALMPTVSSESGNVFADGFGVGVDYDRTLILHDTATGVDETCVVWVDSEPELAEDGTLSVGEDGEPTVPYDYTVRKVGVSQNVTNIALKRRGS